MAEISPQFRYEKSGELSGLMRVRMFCLADAHIFVPVDRVKEEIKSVLDLIDYANGVFGLVKGVNYRYRLSLGDRKDSKKYFKDDKAWDNAEAVLRSVQMNRVGGQEETAFTVQYDFVMPKRFDLKYINQNGKEEQPIVVHRSSIGAFERTMALLIEFYAGAFPTWLSPVQVRILPIGEGHQAYASEVLQALKGAGVRAELNESGDTLGKRIREAEMQKIPYILVLGDKELEAKAVNVRKRHVKETETVPLTTFVGSITKEITERK